MDQKDPYKILNVPRNASQDEIRRSYRRLAKELHPDRNPGNKSAERRFKEVAAAYEVLRDPQRRAQFDQFGAGGPRPDFRSWSSHGESPFGGSVDVDFGGLGDLGSIFEQFFRRPGGSGGGRRAKQRAAVRGGDIEHTLDLGFEEAIRGASRELRLSIDGSAAKTERIQVRIPAGVANGQRIRLKGKGQPGPGGAGDLFIRCRVSPHPYFRREGNDIYLELPLGITEAALGAKIDVPTLAGVTRLTVPPGTSGGTKLRLRGRGVRDQRTGNAGDMYVIPQIAVPKELSERARELLDELAAELKQEPRAQTGWPK